MDASIFKSYDVRGIYPTELDEEAAYAIGRAAAEHLQAQRLAVGRDMRASSESLHEALVRGITDAGATVIDLGLIITPMMLFTTATEAVDGGIMVTASHNPGEYNGFKFSGKDARPIGLTTGLAQIRDRAMKSVWKEVANNGGVAELDIKGRYHEATRRTAPPFSGTMNVIIDCGNAMGALEVPVYQMTEGLGVATLFEELDGTFPNHEANPLKSETLDTLCEKVVAHKADLGIAYDGDGDRVGFVDELGQPVPGDMILALIARKLLATNPGATILYDLRASKAVPELITELGGTAIECKVGHSNIKAQMKDTDALFAGEVSMHYYYRDFTNAENGTLTALVLLSMMAESGTPLSKLVDEVKRYHHSNEINFTVTDVEGLMADLMLRYADGRGSKLDGLKVTYPEWWFSVRASNTEPVVRLNLEGDTLEVLREKYEELKAVIEAH